MKDCSSLVIGGKQFSSRLMVGTGKYKSTKDMVESLSNSEAEIITIIGNSTKEYSGLIINPAAFTHTSLGIYDALKAISTKVPCVEVHLSNTHQREEIRHKSLTAAACIGQIMGFKGYGYILGLQALLKYIDQES